MDLVGVLYAVGAAITWGLVYTIDQKILTNISPLTLLFIDSFITAIIMMPFFFLDKKPIMNLVHSGKINLLLIFISLILAVVANFLIYSGIKTIGASMASIFEISYPLFVVLFSFLFFRTSVNTAFLIGALLIFLGSIIILKF
ncbi:MAG: EamA family transporter [Ignavibacteriaceae bacterium]